MGRLSLGAAPAGAMARAYFVSLMFNGSGRNQPLTDVSHKTTAELCFMSEFENLYTRNGDDKDYYERAR